MEEAGKEKYVWTRVELAVEWKEEEEETKEGVLHQNVLHQKKKDVKEVRLEET